MMGKGHRWWALVPLVGLVVSTLVSVPVRAADDMMVTGFGDDIVIEKRDSGDSSSARLLATDPLGLVKGIDEVRKYTLGTDTLEMWACQPLTPDDGTDAITVQELVDDANAATTPYFEWLSGDRYHPVFVIGGNIPAGEDCGAWPSDHSSGTANAIIIV